MAKSVPALVEPSVLAAELGDEIPRFPLSASLGSSVPRLAAEVREHLGVSVAQQLQWREPDKALRLWRESVEHGGLLVFQFPEPPLGPNAVDVSEARGFSIPDDPLPVIAVNAADPPLARIFTLFHELAHILLRGSGVCDLASVASLPPEQRRVEVFCNAFSAEFLLPREDFLGHVSSPRKRRSWPDEQIEALSRAFSVSREVVVRRLLDLGLATKSFYREKRAQYSEEAASRREAGKNSSREFRVPYYRMILRSVGPSYASSVLRAMHSGRISASSAAGFLRVKVKHLGRIEESVFGRAW